MPVLFLELRLRWNRRTLPDDELDGIVVDSFATGYEALFTGALREAPQHIASGDWDALRRLLFGYCRRTARNLIFDYLRRRHGTSAPAPLPDDYQDTAADDPADVLQTQERQQQIRRVLSLMSAEARDLLIAWSNCGLDRAENPSPKPTYQELAAKFRVTLSNIRSRIHRAIAEFVEIWKLFFPDDPLSK